MYGSPQGNQNRDSTDLVAELRQREHESALAVQRQEQERLAAIARDKAKARRKSIAALIIGIVILAALAVAGKFAWDWHRIDKALATAEESLDAGTPGDLDLAVTALEGGLAIDDDHEKLVRTMALVRAHQAATSEDAEALTAAIDAASGAGGPEVEVAKGVAAALDGDMDGVEGALGEVGSGASRHGVARLRAWLSGTAALAHVDDANRVRAAATELADQASDDGWAPGHRRLATLMVRTGQAEDALARLETAREKNPGDIGIACDEALIHAILARHADGVKSVATRLVDADVVPPRDRARLRLALGIVSLRAGKDAGKDDLAKAWKTLPQWDQDSRDLALEAAMTSGHPDLAKEWLEKAKADEATLAIHDAWKALLDGDPTSALEKSAKLPQDHPRIAYLQALALLEQGRFDEAAPWVKRALSVYGPRLELRVADARIQAQTGDTKAVAESLRKLAKEHGTAAPRVYTALGEAQLKLAEGGKADKKPDKKPDEKRDEDAEKEAEKTLRKAVDKEPKPARAAFLLAQLLRERLGDKPKVAAEVIQLLDKAADIDANTAQYRDELGRFLADHGDLAEAERVLRTRLEEAGVGPAVYLALARTVVMRGEEGIIDPDANEVAAWLVKAETAGANKAATAIVRARMWLVTGTSKTLPNAAATLAAQVRSAPKDYELRAVFGDALRRRKDYTNARATLNDALGKAEPGNMARLQIVKARVERDDGGERLAAGLAYKAWEAAQKSGGLTPNERIALARESIEFWVTIDNDTVPATITKGLVAKVPWRAEAFALRAVAQLRDKRKIEEGCATAKKALEMDKNLAEAHYAKAECHIKNLRYTSARKELAKAIEGARGKSDKAKYERRLRVLR